MDTISLISLKIILYTPQGVYCEMYPLLEGNIERVKSQYSIFYNDILIGMIASQLLKWIILKFDSSSIVLLTMCISQCCHNRVLYWVYMDRYCLIYWAQQTVRASFWSLMALGCNQLINGLIQHTFKINFLI